MPEVEPRPEDYNPSPHVIPEGENATPLGVVGGDCRPTEKVIIVMCGLPATGKTHIANRIVRYLSFFLDIDTRIFNVGDYRRRFFGAKCPAEFFDHSNDEYMKKREQACDAALADLMEFMKIDGVRVGVLDSTNSTKKRRAHIREVLKKLKCKVIFLESICDKTEVSDKTELISILDEWFWTINLALAHTNHASLQFCQLIEQNIKNIKVNTPDYKDVDPDKAFDDFQKRRNMYSNVYETLDKVDGPYMKVINSETFIVHSVRGFLPQKVR